jgi:nicotinamidase-related amidase
MAEQLSIDKKKTTVLIMDYQYRQLSNFPEAFQKEIIARANKVLDRARQEKLPIIFVEVQRGQRTPETELHKDILPKAGEPLLTKNKVGPFTSTDLDERLKKLGTKTLIILGIRTSGCVLTTVRCAADMDYQLIVLSDCCADADEELQRVLMGKVIPWQAKVITSGEFFQALK